MQENASVRVQNFTISRRSTPPDPTSWGLPRNYLPVFLNYSLVPKSIETPALTVVLTFYIIPLA